MIVVDVPEEFIPISNLKYPPHQDLSKSIEPRAFDFFSTSSDSLEFSLVSIVSIVIPPTFSNTISLTNEFITMRRIVVVEYCKFSVFSCFVLIPIKPY